MTYPKSVSVGYLLNNRIEVFGGIWIHGAEYQTAINVEGLEITDLFDIAPLNNEQRASFRFNEQRIGAGVNLWLSSKFSLRLEAGYINDINISLSGIEDANLFQPDFDDSFYLQLGLGISI